MAEPTLRDLFSSPDYAEALRKRILDGTAKKFEVDLARSLGIEVTEEDRVRGYLQAMDRDALGMLTSLSIVAESAASRTLRVVRTATFTGLVFPTDVDVERLRMKPSDYDPAGSNTVPATRTQPEPTQPPAVAASEETDESLLPPKVTA